MSQPPVKARCRGPEKPRTVQGAVFFMGAIIVVFVERASRNRNANAFRFDKGLI
jgi:hypothetical protein